MALEKLGRRRHLDLSVLQAIVSSEDSSLLCVEEFLD
jgi:hypothetical protein